MEKKLLHTPEGVRDIYNGECERKIYLQDKIHKTLLSYGYETIQTPTFEFFDIYNKDKGSVESKNMYKFFDREGYTLVLRPDMTPAIARAASKYYMDETMPLRFCCVGNTFINHAEHQGKLKETTQLGAELIGDNKSDADAEIIALTINALKNAGLEDFQIEIGHVDYFKGLIEASGLEDDKACELKELILNKNYFGIEELINQCHINEDIKHIFTRLYELVGSIDVINTACSLYTNDKIMRALNRMKKVYSILQSYGLEKYISFDLSIFSNYKYYTGVIFKAYTYGTGEAIATGGRYDNLLAQFGKNSPAIGVGINLDHILIALERQKIDIDCKKEKILILYEDEKHQRAINKAIELRNHGKRVATIRKSSKKSIDDYKVYCKEFQFTTFIYLDDDKFMEIQL